MSTVSDDRSSTMSTPASVSKQTEKPTKPAKQKRPPTFKNPGELVTFIIGEEEHEFMVHKDFACHYVESFEYAFNNMSIYEGQTQTYHLVDTTARAFELLVQWLYSQKLVLVQLEDRQMTEEDEEDQADEDCGLVELWVLAEKLKLPKLQDLVIDSIEKIRIKVEMVPSHTVKYVYEHTEPGSKLRKFFLDCCAVDMGSIMLSETAQHYPWTFLIDLASYLIQIHKDIEWEDRDMSDFHVAQKAKD